MVVSTQPGSWHPPLSFLWELGFAVGTDPLHQYGYFQSISKTFDFVGLEGAAEPVAGVQSLATIPVALSAWTQWQISTCFSTHLSRDV